MPDVSIIIINYNVLRLLDNCLQSLVYHTKGVTFEVIVVDNKSEEGNVEEIINKYSGIRLIKNDTNVGFAAANNIALNFAAGKYILFLNNDVLFIDNVIKKVFDFAESRSDKIFVGIQLLNADKSKQESVVSFPSIRNAVTENFFLYKIFKRSEIFNKYYQNEIELSEPTEVDVIRGAFIFCPKDEVIKLNGFDERFFFYSEETDLCYRFKRIGGKIILLPNLQLIHYGGSAADKNLWFKYKNQATGKIQFYQKHFYGLNFVLVILIHWIGLFMRGVIFSFAGLISINKNLIVKGYYFFKQLFVYPKNRFN